MVTITGFQQKKNAEGKTFIVLEMEGSLQVQTSQTGKLYAFTPKCTIPSTVDSDSARGLIGTKLPGTIEKLSCPPYEFTNQTTGETVTLNYRHTYCPSAINSESKGRLEPQKIIDEIEVI